MISSTTPVMVRPPRVRSRSRWPYVILASVFTASVAYQIGTSFGTTRRIHNSLPYVELQEASARIDVVTADAAAAGVRRGDILVAVNGRPYTGLGILAQEEAKALAGKRLLFTVRRPGETATREIEIPVTPTRGRLGQHAVIVLLLFVTPWFCLFLASWVVLVRPRDRLSWLLLAMLLGFTQLFGSGRITQAWPAGFSELGTVYHVGLASAWPIFMFLFGFYFPEPFPAAHPFARWSKIFWWAVVAPLAVDGLIDTVIRTVEISNYATVASLNRAVSHLDPLFETLIYLAVGGFFGFIFTKSSPRSLLPADARRRLRLLYWGATVAMTPALLVSIFAQIRHVAFEVLPQWLIYPVLTMLLLFPLTLAYVIVVQRALDVRVVIRQGLQYGLAKTGIRILQFIAIAIVIATAFALGSNTNRSGKMIVIGIAVAVGFSIPRFGERLRHWTDRRFFREAYNAEQVLSELSDHVGSVIETRPLIETVATRIAETLHVRNVAVLLGAAPFRPAFALGYSSTPDVVFPSGAGTVKVLEGQREPARVYFDDPDSWLYRNPEVSEEERHNLAQLQAELLLPLSTRDKLLGFISLGPKRSAEPYSGTDVRLLKSVAMQTGLALENARLISAIAEEVAQRERLNREVEIAREVQERLFPQSLPAIAGLEYAGACRPALGVGGDYYDFLALPGGQLGIAIGDVSGKGIAAALMMASLQASLRGEATRAPENLAALVANVNRLVYQASSANRYATFFYAQYDPQSRRVTYVNAGHNPPMLFHSTHNGWQVSRLEVGGTVVGLMENFPFEQTSVALHPGDVVVAFTDGISEAMNASDEEWGEERLAETVKCCANLPLSDMISRIMRAADTFVAGAQQHDDMTLVILRAAAENAGDRVLEMPQA